MFVKTLTLFFLTCALSPSIRASITTHHLVELSQGEDSIQLEDGSIWKISYYDSHKAATWHPLDSLTITQNTRWFTDFIYQIGNEYRGSSIEANLLSAPLKEKSSTRSVTAIEEGIIVLDNKTHWIVSPLDVEKLKAWEVNNTIIIGLNGNQDFSWDAILINAEINQSVRTRQL